MLDKLTKRLELHALSTYTFVKCVSIGTISLNFPLTEDIKAEQEALLQQCLNLAPRGQIIGKDAIVVNYRVAGDYVRRELVTYHIGFKKKPYWLLEMG